MPVIRLITILLITLCFDAWAEVGTIPMVRYRVVHHDNTTDAEGVISLTKSSDGGSVGDNQKFDEIRDVGLLAIKVYAMPGRDRVTIYATFDLNYDFKGQWMNGALDRNNPGQYRTYHVTQKVSTHVGQPGVIRITDKERMALDIEFTPLEEKKEPLHHHED